MKKFNLLFILLTFTTLSALTAQEQYLDEQYDVSVQTNVVYGSNATILPVIFQITQEAVPRPLITDIYTPDDGGNNDRPVMLVLHNGYFLPHPQNINTRAESVQRWNPKWHLESQGGHLGSVRHAEDPKFAM